MILQDDKTIFRERLAEVMDDQDLTRLECADMFGIFPQNMTDRFYPNIRQCFEFAQNVCVDPYWLMGMESLRWDREEI